MTQLQQKTKILAEFVALGTYAIHSENYAFFKDNDLNKYRVWCIGDGDLDLEFDCPYEAAEKYLEITENERIVKTDDEIDTEFSWYELGDSEQNSGTLQRLPAVKKL